MRTAPMRFFERLRLAWVTDTVTRTGHINRSDIVNEFDVSIQTASKDIGNYIALSKAKGSKLKKLVYDRVGKCYRTSVK